MRLALTVFLLAAVAAAVFCCWQWRDAEARLRLLGERLTQETHRREGLEMDLFEARTAHQRLVADVPALIAKRVPRPESQPTPPPAEPAQMLKLRQKINSALTAAGHPEVRVFRIRVADGPRLRGVQVHRFGGEGLPVEAWLAEELLLELNLGRPELVLRLTDGVLLVEGRREPLPEGGVPLGLGREETLRLMSELAEVVQLTGSLAADPATTRPVRPSSWFSSEQRDEWVARLNELLGRADPGHRMSCLSLGGVVDGAFRDVMLLGYARGLLLDQVLSARSMVIECTPGGSVQLVLRDGTLDRDGRKVELPADGYRVVLPGVPGEQARALAGLVAGAR
jgi:hypothetical protein